MRKALIAVITASALFAIGAFATTFDVTSGNIASGSDTVEACADEALVSYETDPAVGTDDFLVTKIIVTFYTGGSTTTDCEGALVDLAVGDTSTTPTSWTNYDTKTVASSGTAVEWTGLSVPVANVDAVRVLADDDPIPTS